MPGSGDDLTFRRDLRARVLREAGEWTAARARDLSIGAVYGDVSLERARVELNRLAAEKVLIKHGRLGRAWTPSWPCPRCGDAFPRRDDREADLCWPCEAALRDEVIAARDAEIERLRGLLELADASLLRMQTACCVERERAESAAAERDRLNTTLNRVRDEHPRDDSNPAGPWCPTCQTVWPCRTRTAIDQPKGGEHA